MAEPPFFTWTETTYPDMTFVPERVRAQIKKLWLKGATPEEIAHVFNMPPEWIYTFALGETKKSLN